MPFGLDEHATLATDRVYHPLSDNCLYRRQAGNERVQRGLEMGGRGRKVGGGEEDREDRPLGTSGRGEGERVHNEKARAARVWKRVRDYRLILRSRKIVSTVIQHNFRENNDMGSATTICLERSPSYTICLECSPSYTIVQSRGLGLVRVEVIFIRREVKEDGRGGGSEGERKRGRAEECSTKRRRKGSRDETRHDGGINRGSAPRYSFNKGA